jgi:hypothetical protein
MPMRALASALLVLTFAISHALWTVPSIAPAVEGEEVVVTSSDATKTSEVRSAATAHSSGSALETASAEPDVQEALALESVRYEENDARIAYTAGWKQASNAVMSGGTYHYTRDPGAAMAVAFEGTSIAWIGPKYSSYGQAEVILDGVSQGVVSLYAPLLQGQRVIWQATGLSQGSHTLEIRCLYAREAGASYYSIAADAFEIDGDLLQATAPVRTTRIEDDDARVTFGGAWLRAANASMSDGRYAYTRFAGAGVTISFSGTSVAWIGPRYSSYGMAEVFLDGVSQGVISQYAPVLQTRQVIWSAYGLSPGEHVLHIVVLGQKEPASASTSVCVDGFDVRGSIEDAAHPPGFTRVEGTDSRLSWRGQWAQTANAAMSGGSYRFSKAAGSEVTVTFRGTAISWIAPKDSSYGKAAVYVDDRLVEVVSLYRPELVVQRVVWSVGGLADTTHVVRIRVLGSKEASARYHSVCVDALDVVGEVLQTYTWVEDDDPRLRFRTGSWSYATNGSMSGRSFRYTRTPDARATIVFRGTGIAWVGPKHSSYGQAEVFIDSVSQGVVSQYAPTLQNGQVIWEIAGLDDGVHTLTIAALGTKEAVSAGYSVCVDAVRVAGEVLNNPPVGLSRIEQSDSRLVYVGSWTSGEHSSLSGGFHSYSRTRASELRVAFEGTEISWIGAKAPSYGRAKVYLDGKYVTTVSMFSLTYEPQRVVWAATGLTNAKHEVRIVVTRTAETDSRGYAVAMDAFETRGSFRQASRPVPKWLMSYPWSTFIVVDKSDFRLYWVRNNRLVASYPVAIGRSNAETPLAVWRIGNKYYTSPTSVYGPRKMRLYRRTSTGAFVFTAYNIHGTNVSSSIGTKASAGCIRLYNFHVLSLFPQVPMGTMVVTRQ